MIAAEVQFNFDKLGAAMRAYALYFNKTENEVITKKSKSFAIFLYQALKKMKPEKGSIMAERLAALKSGRGFGHGVKVRPAVYADIAGKYGAVYSLALNKTLINVKRGKKIVVMAPEIEKKGKRMNLQALAVERELKIRESGRGFSAFAVPRLTGDLSPDSDFAREVDSKYGMRLSSVETHVGSEVKYALFRWLGAHNELYKDASEGLSTAKQQAALNEAIIATTQDIVNYIVDQQMKGKIAFGFN